MNFISVYIKEAHANDEWPIRTKEDLVINQHKNNKERIAMANELVCKYKYRLPSFVDDVNDEFSNVYSGWPLQAFIVFRHKIVWYIEPRNPGYYDLRDIKQACINMFQ